MVIETVQLLDTDDSIAEVEEFIHGETHRNSCREAQEAWEGFLKMVRSEGGRTIETLEGAHLARFNDWVIKGVKGEFYPCKPDIFEATYEEVEDAQAATV